MDWKKISLMTKVNTKLLHLRYWNQQVSVRTWQETFHRLITLINNNELTLMQKDSQYDLFQVKEAVRVAESSKRNKGKVFLTS